MTRLLEGHGGIDLSTLAEQIDEISNRLWRNDDSSSEVEQLAAYQEQVDELEKLLLESGGQIKDLLDALQRYFDDMLAVREGRLSSDILSESLLNVAYRFARVGGDVPYAEEELQSAANKE